MTPGEILSRGHDLYVVLAAKGASVAVVPLVLTKHQRAAQAVRVRIGQLGNAYALCASSRLDTGPWSVTGLCLTPADLTACQIAARHARESAAITQRFSPLAVFEDAMPTLRRSGGRRVGAHPTLA